MMFFYLTLHRAQLVTTPKCRIMNLGDELFYQLITPPLCHQNPFR